MALFLVLLCSILFICMALIYKFLFKFQTQKAFQVNGENLQLPPGSKGWPFIGEMLDYIYHISKGTPGKFVEKRKKKYSTKVFKTSLLGQSMAVLCGPEGNKFLFSNENKLVRVWFPSFVDKLFPYSGNISATDQSTRLRSFVAPFFKVDVLRKSVSIMDSVMKQHMISHWNSEKVLVSSMSRKYTSGLSCKLFMSIDEVKTADEFLELTEVIHTGLHSMPINLPGTAFNRGIKASKAIRKEIEKMIKQRRTEIGDQKCSSTLPQDFITYMLLKIDDNGQFLNEFDIAVLLVGLLEGAYANQHNTITLVMMHLSELPDVYDSVLREQLEIAHSKEPNELLTWKDLSCMKYTWNVVCEVLRLFSPVGQFREAITDFEYAGYHIPKGWKMHWVAGAVHRNSEYFQDSDKFDPTRFEGKGPSPYTYVPFGGGPRMCPGMEYARLSILVFIHNAVTKFRWEKLIPNEKLIHGMFSTPAYGLPIHLHPLRS